MKHVLLTLCLAALGTQMHAQTIDTVSVSGKARKFRPAEYIMIMFETVDTLDVTGKTSRFSRTYFFDKEQRMMSSVREYSNPSKPQKGTQVVYNFWQNRLTKVTVTPPRARCADCLSEYYFSGDTLSGMSEKVYRIADPLSFVAKADRLRAKVPATLPWGYFNDETMDNGKKKKSPKRSY